MEGLLGEYLQTRQALWAQSSSMALPVSVIAARCLRLCSRSLRQEDNKGPGGTEGESERLRPLSRFETARIAALARQRIAGRAVRSSEWVVLRKLQLLQVCITAASALHGLIPFSKERRGAGVREPPLLDIDTPTTLTPLDVPPSVPVPHAVLDALRGIHTTQYEHSFAARVYGHAPLNTHGLIAVDWESRAPWSLLMDDVHDHYALAQSVTLYTRVHRAVLISLISSERDLPERPRTPITYASLRPSHLGQVHELLARVFWEGIDGKSFLFLFLQIRCLTAIGH